MRLFADTHIHSCLSPCADQSMTPNNIVNMALIKGLDLIAVTDHNSADNLRAVAAAAVLTGRCPRGAPILVQLPGGTLEVCVQRDDTVLLTGDAAATFSGTVLIQPCKPPRGVV